MRNLAHMQTLNTTFTFLFFIFTHFYNHHHHLVRSPFILPPLLQSLYGNASWLLFAEMTNLQFFLFFFFCYQFTLR